VETGIQDSPSENREPYKKNRFLLEFIPMKIGAGMTSKSKLLTPLVFMFELYKFLLSSISVTGPSLIR
jgi:hypothetical protein